MSKDKTTIPLSDDDVNNAPAAAEPAAVEIELTDDELQALCRDRMCPACPVGAEAEDVRLRALAELDNSRKRLEREREDFRKFASEKVLGALLPVLDNLDLALNHAPEDEACKNFVLGVDMTRKVFLDVLSASGLTPVGEAGEEFTPERHEALGQLDRDDLEPGTVAQVMQRGYLLNGRLLRPAKVMVSKKPE